MCYLGVSEAAGRDRGGSREGLATVREHRPWRVGGHAHGVSVGRVSVLGPRRVHVDVLGVDCGAWLRPKSFTCALLTITGPSARQPTDDRCRCTRLNGLSAGRCRPVKAPLKRHAMPDAPGCVVAPYIVYIPRHVVMDF